MKLLHIFALSLLLAASMAGARADADGDSDGGDYDRFDCDSPDNPFICRSYRSDMGSQSKEV